MKIRINVIWIYLFTAMSAYSQGNLRFDGMQYTGEIVKVFDVKDGGTINMKDITADVSVTGEERNNVEVIEKFRINAYSETAASKILQEEKASYIQKGSTITVKGNDQSRKFESKFVVRVPYMFNVSIEASSGDISAEMLKGHLDIATSGGDIEAYDISGWLNATTSGGDIKMNRINGNLYAKTSGGDISVQGLKGSGELFTSGGDIDISNVTGKTLDVRTSGGDIGLNNIDVVAKVHTSGGDIIVTDVKKDLILSTSGGDIDIKKAGGFVDGHTSGGDIYIGEVKGYCKLNTSGGDIEIGNASAGAEVNTSGGDIIIGGCAGALYARTSGGDIEARKLYRKENTENSIELASSGGDILLYLPQQVKATVKAELQITNRRGIEKEIISDFPLTIDKIQKGSRLLITGHGLINGGGDNIVLKTSDGNIRIRKASRK